MRKIMITLVEYFNNNLLSIVHDLFHAYYLHTAYMTL